MAVKNLMQLAENWGEESETLTPVVELGVEARAQVMAHVDGGKTAVVIARYGETEEDQVWASFWRYPEPVYECAYGMWSGGAAFLPVEDLDECLRMLNGEAEEICAPEKVITALALTLDASGVAELTFSYSDGSTFKDRFMGGCEGASFRVVARDMVLPDVPVTQTHLGRTRALTALAMAELYESRADVWVW